ncbi:MAG: DUF2764 family protein [Marinilabiliaceae bacterium]|nr:DUF2764 family protein [Marinilabiliaceae bacterium]
MARNYYCLVAGLPDLVMEDRKLAFTSVALRELLQEDLHPQDYRLVSLFFLPYDHQNIINRLFNKDTSFDKRGLYAEEVIDEVTDKKAFELAEETGLHGYLNNFLNDFYEREEKPARQDAERQLTSAYFQMLLGGSNSFVSAYAQQELTIRNIIVALNGRKYDLEVEKDIIGDGDVVDALKKSRARDFGLTTDVEMLDHLMQIHENPDPLDREMKLDLLRWQFLDEETFFNYFTIEKVLAFTLKLMIVERWFELDEEKGRELFKNLINDLETGYEFPEEFKLSHGKKK